MVAAYYEGDTKVSEKVVQEVKMAPGTDGIDTAIVECEEGKSVLVYLRNDSPAEEEEDDFIPGTPSNKPVDTPNKGTGSEGLSTTTMIIVIVAALCVVGLFLVILATSKPKKKAAKAEEPKAEEPKAEETDDTAE